MLIPRIVGIVTLPTPSSPQPSAPSAPVRAQALRVLCLQDPTEKCQHTLALVEGFGAGLCPLDPGAPVQTPVDQPLPGRPATPRLIAPAQVPTRSPFTVEGRAALLHAICHIEFNAINLALDAVWRFADMPPAFYADWLQVAAEEAQHFTLLHGLLLGLRGPEGQQWTYGSFDAHDGLWAMCEKTAHDVTARMALVPRTLEARGLDATPLIQAKLRKVTAQGGTAAADAQALCDALDIILRDEVGHVAIGNRWYGWLCERQGLDPVAHYRHLVRVHAAPRLKPPFNEAARKQAGFSDTELAYLLTAG